MEPFWPCVLSFADIPYEDLTHEAHRGKNRAVITYFRPQMAV